MKKILVGIIGIGATLAIGTGAMLMIKKKKGEVETATEEQIIGLIYRQGPVQNFDYIIFLPDSEGVEIEEVIRGYSY